jgi:hypothetical protein
MALLTKGQVRTAVRQAFDDASSKRWSDANLDVLIGGMGDMLWSAILDTFEFTTNQQDTVTPAAGGKVDVSSSAGVLSKRFYRLQAVTKASDSSDVQPKLYKEKVPQNSYYMLGQNIVTEPAITGANSLILDYSYLPTRFDQIANDGTILNTEYPEGHELALIYLSASAAIIKGDAENMAQIARLADTAVEALLVHIARRYPIGAIQRIQQVKNSIMRNPLVVANG